MTRNPTVETLLKQQEELKKKRKKKFSIHLSTALELTLCRTLWARPNSIALGSYEMSTVALTSDNTIPDIACDVSASTTGLRKFTRFPNLPTELRLLIFSIALPELRKYRVTRVKAVQQGQQLVFDRISLPYDRLPDITPNLT